MLESPRRSPGPPPSVAFSGSKPGPQSRTWSWTPLFACRSEIFTRAEGACLRTLVRASCVTLNRAVSTSVGRRSSPSGFLVVDLAAFLADLLHLQPDGGAEPEVVERGGPEVCYDVAGLPDRLLHELQDAVEVLAALFGIGRVAAGEGLQELVGARGRLGQAVVHLVGDLAALLLLGGYELADQVLQAVLALGEVRVEPRVLQGTGALVGEAYEGLLVLPLQERFRPVGLEDPDDPVAHQQREVEADEVRFIGIPRRSLTAWCFLVCSTLSREASASWLKRTSRRSPSSPVERQILNSPSSSGTAMTAAVRLETRRAISRRREPISSLWRLELRIWPAS